MSIERLVRDKWTGQLWVWTAIHPDGSVHQHQTSEKMASATEAGMLEHLRKGYPNLNITALRRAELGEYKPPIGPTDRRAYQCGVWDIAMRELGLMPAEQRKSIINSANQGVQGFRDRMSQSRLRSLAGLSPNAIARPRSVVDRQNSFVKV